MDRLEQIEAKLRAGESVSYEDAADLFELTTIGRLFRVPRTEALALLRAKFPDAQQLTAAMRGYLAAFDNMNSGSQH